MYELVIITESGEQVVFTSEDILEVELRKERHIRSMSEGVAEIREAGKKKD